MKSNLLVIVLLGLLLGTVGVWASAVNISGTWDRSVDTGDGRGLHPDGTFVFKQAGEKLTGTLSVSQGERIVTGTVKGDKVEFIIESKDDRGEPFKVPFTGTIESPTKISGTAGDAKGKGTFKWTATKK